MPFGIEGYSLGLQNSYHCTRGTLQFPPTTKFGGTTEPYQTDWLCTTKFSTQTGNFRVSFLCVSSSSRTYVLCWEEKHVTVTDCGMRRFLCGWTYFNIYWIFYIISCEDEKLQNQTADWTNTLCWVILGLRLWQDHVKPWIFHSENFISLWIGFDIEEFATTSWCFENNQ